MDSRIGGRSENQDSCGFCDTPLGFLAVVCDGMGGMQGGSTASSMTVASVIESIKNADPLGNPEEIIESAVKKANLEVINKGEDDPSLQGMGTTITLVLLNEECAFVSYVGDSRVYQLRDGRKVFRTFDHSMVFQMVKSGFIDEEQARQASNSNVILKAIGVDKNLEVEVQRLSYSKGDRFILCTDGFWGNLPESQFLSLVSRKGDLELSLSRAFGKIERAGIESKLGNHDNLSCIEFDTNTYSKLRSKMEKQLTIALAAIALLFMGSVGMNIHQKGQIRKAGQSLSQQVADYKNLEVQAQMLSHAADSLENASRIAEEEAREAEEKAEKAEAEAKKSHKNAEESKKKQEEADQARANAENKRREAEKVTAESKSTSEKAKKAQKEAEDKQKAAEAARNNAEKAQRVAEEAQEKAEAERDEARRNEKKALAEIENLKKEFESVKKGLNEQTEDNNRLKSEVNQLKKENDQLKNKIKESENIEETTNKSTEV